MNNSSNQSGIVGPVMERSVEMVAPPEFIAVSTEVGVASRPFLADSQNSETDA